MYKDYKWSTVYKNIIDFDKTVMSSSDLVKLVENLDVHRNGTTH